MVAAPVITRRAEHRNGSQLGEAVSVKRGCFLGIVLVLGEEYFIGKMGGKEAGPVRELQVASLQKELYFAIMVHASLSRSKWSPLEDEVSQTRLQMVVGGGDRTEASQ